MAKAKAQQDASVGTQESPAGADPNGTPPDADQPTATPRRRPQRFHTISGIEYPIVRSVFDHAQNCVIDHVEITKLVENKKGEEIEVKLIQKVYSKDPALQEKWQRKHANLTEITDV